MRQLDPEPYRPAGRFQGWRINKVFPDDPTLCAGECDLRPKDVILTVNGSPLERPEQLSKLVEGIGEMAELEVRLIRDGKLHERTYAIVD
jgi:type II secretory pathway component PulC